VKLWPIRILRGARAVVAPHDYLCYIKVRGGNVGFRRGAAAAVMIVSAGLVFRIAAQAPGAADRAEQDAHFNLDVNRVAATFSVTDRKGHFAAMTREDFVVFDNRREQKILEFSAEAELPLRLALLLDSSGSVRDRFHFLQEAAIGFLTSSIRPGHDEAMLVAFDIVPAVVAEFNGDVDALAEKIREVRPGGATSLYDAIELAARRMTQTSQTSRYRYAIVIFSDGDDNQSRLTRQQALEAAQRANAVVFAVSTSEQNVPTQGDKILKFLTEETGGTALFPFKVEDMARSFDTIAKELRHQYNLLYRPEPLAADGQFHTIEIRLKQPKGGFLVRARKGYYAPPAPVAAR
jgi:VWFA-related protein